MSSYKPLKFTIRRSRIKINTLIYGLLYLSSPSVCLLLHHFFVALAGDWLTNDSHRSCVCYVSGNILSTLQHYHLYFTRQPQEACTVTGTILQKMKSRLRDVIKLVRDRNDLYTECPHF